MAVQDPKLSDIFTGIDVVPVTPANDLLPLGPCRALWVTAAGSLSFETLDGHTRTGFPCVANVMLPFGANKILIGTTATVWAIY